MGGYIVSIDLALDDWNLLSLVPFAAATACWIVLVAVFVAGFTSDRESWHRLARSPGALTCVAATALLGDRLLSFGWESAAAASAAGAALLWISLVGRVARHVAGRARGVTFMLTVATASLAALIAELGRSSGQAWLDAVSIGLLIAGLVLYGFVLTRFPIEHLTVASGDHWIAGGALAVSALAAAYIAQGLSAASWARVLTLVIWTAAAVWFPALVCGDLLWRRWRYDLRRWSTVFPVAMYAASSFAAGVVLGVRPLIWFAQVWTWAGFALWLVVGIGMARRWLRERTSHRLHRLGQPR